MKNLILLPLLGLAFVSCGKKSESKKPAFNGTLLFSVTSDDRGLKNVYGDGHTETLTETVALIERGQRPMPIYKVSSEVYDWESYDIFWEVENSFKTLPYCDVAAFESGTVKTCVVGSYQFKDWRSVTLSNGQYDNTSYNFFEKGAQK